MGFVGVVWISQKQMNSSPVGLHLWAVHLEQARGQQLWIITSCGDLRVAAKKAAAFMKRFRREQECPRAQVLSIEHRGTIDA